MENLDNNTNVGIKTKCGVVALVGPANAGKSSLVNSLVGNKVSIVTSKEQTTRFKVMGILTEKESQIIFIDTPGFLARRYRGALSRFISSQTAESTQDCDLIALVLDAAVACRDNKYIKRALDSLKSQNIKNADLIVLNKVDLVDKIQLLPIIKKLSELESAEIIPISVKKNSGVNIVEKVINSRIPNGPHLFGKEKVTDKEDYVIVAEIVREKLTEILRNELPYSLVALVNSWEKEEKLLRIGIDIVIDKESQKKIVIGKGGSVLKEVGSKAREELEDIFETKIYLNLKVKVKKDWTKDANKVEEWHLKLLSSQ